MPQVPPFLAQCLQYLQFLQAEQYLEPVHFRARTAALECTQNMNKISVKA